MAAQPSRTTRKGFTLLELMIAVFLMAFSVTVLLGTAGNSSRIMGYSNHLAVINMLTRAKMQDIEYEVLAEGFTEGFAQTMSGDFADEGYPDIEWDATIEAIEVSDDTANNFVTVISEQLYGTGDEAGTLSGNAAISQFLPMMISFMPIIINRLGKRIRRVDLELRWTYLGNDQSLQVSQYIVQVEPPEDAGSISSGAGLGGDPDDPDLGGIGGAPPPVNPTPVPGEN